MEKTLNEMLTEYREKTIFMEGLDLAMNELLDAVRKSDKYLEAQELCSQTKRDLIDLRQGIEFTAIGEYEETKNKKPADGLQIKIYKDVEILDDDETKIIKWASDAAPSILKIDLTKLKKYAIGAAEAGAPLPFVKLVEKPKVFIESFQDEKYPVGKEW